MNFQAESPDAFMEFVNLAKTKQQRNQLKKNENVFDIMNSVFIAEDKSSRSEELQRLFEIRDTILLHHSPECITNYPILHSYLTCFICFSNEPLMLSDYLKSLNQCVEYLRWEHNKNERRKKFVIKFEEKCLDALKDDAFTAIDDQNIYYSPIVYVFKNVFDNKEFIKSLSHQVHIESFDTIYDHMDTFLYMFNDWLCKENDVDKINVRKEFSEFMLRYKNMYNVKSQ